MEVRPRSLAVCVRPLTLSLGGGGYSGRSSGFHDSGSKTAEYEEYDAGDWEDSDRRGGSGARASSSSSSPAPRASTTSKPTPAPPKPAPPQPEVNLFDFDDDEQPPVPSKGFSPPMASAEGPLFVDVAGFKLFTSCSAADDFDDFQSAPGFPAAAPAPATSAHQNVFDLLKATPAAAAPSFAPAPSYSQPPLASFAPLQAQPRPAAIQQQTSYSHAPVARPTPTTSNSAPAAKPASDFSDLFSSFSTPGAASGGMAPSKAGPGGKQSMAEIAAARRQEQLFKSAPQGGPAAPSGWDSLL